MQGYLCNYRYSPIKFNLLTHDQQRHSHGFVDYPDVNDVELLILLHSQQRSLDYHSVPYGTYVMMTAILDSNQCSRFCRPTPKPLGQWQLYIHFAEAEGFEPSEPFGSAR